jgi:hypothetical protein
LVVFALTVHWDTEGLSVSVRVGYAVLLAVDDNPTVVELVALGVAVELSVSVRGARDTVTDIDRVAYGDWDLEPDLEALDVDADALIVMLEVDASDGEANVSDPDTSVDSVGDAVTCCDADVDTVTTDDHDLLFEALPSAEYVLPDGVRVQDGSEDPLSVADDIALSLSLFVGDTEVVTLRDAAANDRLVVGVEEVSFVIVRLKLPRVALRDTLGEPLADSYSVADAEGVASDDGVRLGRDLDTDGRLIVLLCAGVLVMDGVSDSVVDTDAALVFDMCVRDGEIDALNVTLC